MNEKQQIEELARICASDCGECTQCENYRKGTLNGIDRCYLKRGEMIYNAGYRKQSEWISVEERVPTDERDVLAYYGFDRGDGDLGKMFIGVLTYFAYDPNPHFQHESTGLRVTHWMPLPEPPKGEE